MIIEQLNIYQLDIRSLIKFSIGSLSCGRGDEWIKKTKKKKRRKKIGKNPGNTERRGGEPASAGADGERARRAIYNSVFVSASKLFLSLEGSLSDAVYAVLDYGRRPPFAFNERTDLVGWPGPACSRPRRRPRPPPPFRTRKTTGAPSPRCTLFKMQILGALMKPEGRPDELRN